MHNQIINPYYLVSEIRKVWVISWFNMEGDGLSVFNPSVIQINHDLDAEQAREDEEELQRINEGVTFYHYSL